MIKLGIIMFTAIILLFYALAYIGVGMKGLLCVYFVLLLSVSVLAFIVRKRRKPNRREEERNAQ